MPEGERRELATPSLWQLSLFLLPPCRPHVNPGNIDLSDGALPPSLPRGGAPFRFQRAAGPTETKAPDPEPSDASAGPGPKEGSSRDGEPPSSRPRWEAQETRPRGDLESSSPARRRALPRSFASNPSASSAVLPVLEIPAARWHGKGFWVLVTLSNPKPPNPVQNP